MGLLGFFKKNKQTKDVSRFDFPQDADLEAPPPPPSMEEGDDTQIDDENVPNFDAESEDRDFHPFKEDSVRTDAQEDYEDEANGFDDDIPVPAQQIKEEAAHGSPNPVISSQSNTAFVYVDDYKVLLDNVNHIKGNVSKLGQGILKINHERQNEEKMFHNWHNQAQDILRKLSYIDHTLFEKRR